MGCSRVPKLEGPAPNILLIVLDAARADHFSCYGYQRPTTPNIDRVAAGGLRFTQAVSSSSWTTPSHASLFTGLLPAEHGTHNQHAWLIDRIPTLAELLKRRGYRTAAFSNNPHVDRAQNLHRGFELFEAVWSKTDAVTPDKPHNTEHTNGLVRSFIEKIQGSGAPFFIFINYMDVHQPYDPPEPYRTMFLKPGQAVSARVDSACRHAPLLNSKALVPSEQEEHLVRAVYDGALNYLDARIGELLEFLRRRNMQDNTLLIITSDHGELFGEYGYFAHGGMLKRPLVHIPLIVSHRALIPQPGVRQAPVAIADIFHTLADLLELEGAAATGAPVRNLLDPSPVEAPCYSQLKVGRTPEAGFVYRHDSRSVWRPDRRQFILTETEAYECYDLAADFEEMNNLCPRSVSRQEVVSEVTAFESRLKRLVETPQDLRITRESRVDPQQERALRALGYIGGSEIDQVLQTMEEDNHVMEHLKTGIYFYLNDSLSAADREIRTVLKMNPNNYIARKYLGAILFDRGKYKDAVRVLRSVLGKTEMDEAVRLLLAASLAEIKRPDEALELFSRFSDEHPEESQAALGAAKILMARRDYGGADVYLRRAVENNPDNLEILRMAIGAYLGAGNLARARELLLVEIEKEPSVNARLVLADVCSQMGLIRETREHLEKSLAMQMPPNVRAMVEKKLKEL